MLALNSKVNEDNRYFDSERATVIQSTEIDDFSMWKRPFTMLKENRSGEVLSCLIAYHPFESLNIHVTFLSNIVTVEEYPILFRISQWIKEKIGDEIFVSLGKEETFKSNLYPESRIFKAKFETMKPENYINLKRWDKLHRLLRSYKFKPHITFKDTFVHAAYLKAYEQTKEWSKFYGPTLHNHKGKQVFLGLPFRLCVTFAFQRYDTIVDSIMSKPDPGWAEYLGSVIRKPVILQENEFLRENLLGIRERE